MANYGAPSATIVRKRCPPLESLQRARLYWPESFRSDCRKEFFTRIGHIRTVDGGPAATSNLFHLEIRWRPSGLPAIRSPRRSLRRAEADTLTGATDRQGLMLRGLRTSAECSRTTVPAKCRRGRPVRSLPACRPEYSRVESDACQVSLGRKGALGVKREAGEHSSAECNAGAAHATVSETETATDHCASSTGRCGLKDDPLASPETGPRHAMGGSRWAMPDRLRYNRYRASVSSFPVALDQPYSRVERGRS